MKPTIYLAGPICGLTYDQATDWRLGFAAMVGPSIQCLSPMRGKEYLALERDLHDSYPDKVMSCDRGIITRDFYDCNRASMVVANLRGAQKVSIGTVLEIGWAFAARVPLVVVMEKTGNPHDHSMVRECIGWRVETMSEAAHIARVTLWP